MTVATVVIVILPFGLRRQHGEAFRFLAALKVNLSPAVLAWDTQLGERSFESCAEGDPCGK